MMMDNYGLVVWIKQENNDDLVTETVNPWRRSLKGILCDKCSPSPCHYALFQKSCFLRSTESNMLVKNFHSTSQKLGHC